MKYCSKCVKEIMDKAMICPGCGCAQENNVQNNVQGNSVPQIKEALSDIQKEAWSNSGWSLLGFFIPIVGLILYLVYKNSANNSKVLKCRASPYSNCVLYFIDLVIMFNKPSSKT